MTKKMKTLNEKLDLIKELTEKKEKIESLIQKLEKLKGLGRLELLLVSKMEGFSYGLDISTRESVIKNEIIKLKSKVDEKEKELNNLIK